MSTTKIKYVGKYGGVSIPALGIDNLPRGEAVEVDGEVAKKMVASGEWETAAPAKTKPAPKKEEQEQEKEDE